jgi:hypothetical protein
MQKERWASALGPSVQNAANQTRRIHDRMNPPGALIAGVALHEICILLRGQSPKASLHHSFLGEGRLSRRFQINGVGGLRPVEGPCRATAEMTDGAAPIFRRKCGGTIASAGAVSIGAQI